MLDKVERADVPSHAIAVSLGEGDWFRYSACGMDNVYVCGVMDAHFTDLDEWFKFRNLRLMNQLISEALSNEADLIGPAQFTFLRKQTGLTLHEFCSLNSIDLHSVEAWLEGRGFLPDGLRESVCAMVSDIHANRSTTAQLRDQALNLHQAA